jgi:hypothetical protein
MIILKQQINYIADITIIPNPVPQTSFYEEWKELEKKWTRLESLFKIREQGQSYRDEIDDILINIIKPNLPKLLDDDLFSRVLKTVYGSKGYDKIVEDLGKWLTQNIGIEWCIRRGFRSHCKLRNRDWEWGFDILSKKVYPIFKAVFDLSGQMSKQAMDDWEDLLIYAYNFPNEFRAWITRIFEGYAPFPRRVRVKIEPAPQSPNQPAPPSVPVQPYTPPAPFEPPKPPEPPKEPEPQKAGFDFGKYAPYIVGVLALALILQNRGQG